MSKRAKASEIFTIVFECVSYNAIVPRESARIAADAAVHALSGRVMTARDVFARIAPGCYNGYRWPCGPCDMAHCPRLR